MDNQTSVWVLGRQTMPKKMSLVMGMPPPGIVQSLERGGAGVWPDNPSARGRI